MRLFSLCSFVFSVALAGSFPVFGQAAGADALVLPSASGLQAETDEYTRYELLDPATASFRITYEVTATTAGAKVFYNPIRKGSVASDESVLDAMTGKPLKFEVVHGADAKLDPLMAKADAGTDYIKVTLGRAVPEHGQGRVVISKTYKDQKSYFVDAGQIVFDRPLGIRRNKIVLPPGYEVVGLTVASQILTEPDGRIAVSFLHAGAGEAPLVLRAVKDAQVGAKPRAVGEAKSWESPYQGLTERERLAERAHQDRDIVYFLQQPETHSFSLYHDYTESRAGVNAYANVVRAGSKASAPSAYVLDTGEKLPVKVMSGAEMARATPKIDAREEVDAKAEVVVIPFAAVKAGESLRLRIAETYTAPASYRLEGDELVFERSLGRPRNAVVLPSGWYVSECAAPATVSRMEDGRVKFEFWDGAPEAVDVLLKARRRVAAGAGQAVAAGVH